MISCALEPNNARLSMTRWMSWAFVRQLNFPVNDGDKIRDSSLGPSFAETLLGVLSRYDSTVNQGQLQPLPLWHTSFLNRAIHNDEHWIL